MWWHFPKVTTMSPESRGLSHDPNPFSQSCSFGALLGLSWLVCGFSWAHLCFLEALLGYTWCSRALLGSLGALLGLSWALLELTWGSFWRLLESLGTLLGFLGFFWRSLRGLLASLGDVLGSFTPIILSPCHLQ